MLERNFTSLPRLPDFIIILRRNILLFYLKHNQNLWSETFTDTRHANEVRYNLPSGRYHKNWDKNT